MKRQKAMKLVNALRTGNYLQGRGQLVRESNDGDRFCCLGVACNISEQPLGWVLRGRYWQMDGYMDILPFSIQKEYGFETRTGQRRDARPIIIRGKRYKNLTDANDRGATFNQIADYIEGHYKDL